MNMAADKTIAANSATGVASHTPVTSKSAGRISIAMTINTKERENASTAEIRPLDSAVNIPLANTLKPIKIRAREQIRFPVTARSYTGLSGWANTDTSGSVSASEPMRVTAAITLMIFKLMRISFFNFS